MKAVENWTHVLKAKYLEIVNYGVCDYMEEFSGLFQIAINHNCNWLVIVFIIVLTVGCCIIDWLRNR